MKEFSINIFFSSKIFFILTNKFSIIKTHIFICKYRLIALLYSRLIIYNYINTITDMEPVYDNYLSFIPLLSYFLYLSILIHLMFNNPNEKKNISTHIFSILFGFVFILIYVYLMQKLGIMDFFLRSIIFVLGSIYCTVEMLSISTLVLLHKGTVVRIIPRLSISK